MLNFIYLTFTFTIWNYLILFSFLLMLYLVRSQLRKLTHSAYKGNLRVISFVHPFCNDCGGGEKVLWMMIKGLLIDMKPDDNKKIKINILAGVKDDSRSILNKLAERFNLNFNVPSHSVLDIELVRLKSAFLLKPKPMFTMLLQVLGQIIFAFEIITTVHSDVYFDTTGLPFTYAILNFLGKADVVAYTHYPFISSDMINDVRNGVQGVHSRGLFSKLAPLRYLKLVYYYTFLQLYKFSGRFVQFTFCNSSWTLKHIESLWSDTTCRLLYPPCSIDMYNSEGGSHIRRNIIVSFAQFRPEKNHKMQIDILNKLKQRGVKDIQLFIIGAVRDDNDKFLLESLKQYVDRLGLNNEVRFYVNLPFTEVKSIFDIAKFGIHTMRDEHFGISIIEMMAAGLVVVAHRSAGPLLDIIGPSKNVVGLLADSKLVFNPHSCGTICR